MVINSFSSLALSPAPNDLGQGPPPLCEFCVMTRASSCLPEMKSMVCKDCFCTHSLLYKGLLSITVMCHIMTFRSIMDHMSNESPIRL